MLVSRPGLWDKIRVLGETTCRQGGNKHETQLEVNQEPFLYDSAVLTAVPLCHVSVRFYFCISADAMMTPVKRLNAVTMERYRSTWGHHLVWWPPAVNIILVKKHKMKRRELAMFSRLDIAPLLIHNFVANWIFKVSSQLLLLEATKLPHITNSCLAQGLLRTIYHELHPHILYFSSIFYYRASFHQYKNWIHP